MHIEQTPLLGCFLIKPTVFADQRGYFYESFNTARWEKETGLTTAFVQDNEAFSNYGVIRGLHFQTGEHAQAKLVRVITGSVLDVVVDVRPDSATYGQHYAVELSGENKLQLYIPRGMAHGYAVLENNTRFFYKCDNFYNKASEGGILFSDPALGIHWPIPEDQWVVSEKDLVLPKLGV